MAEKRKALTQLVYATGMGKSPARVNRETGICYLNAELFPKLPKAWQEFIKLHEEGHYVLNTKNENEVDSYAFYKYAKRGLPLSECVKALTRILNPENASHRTRVALQVERVKWYDYYVNGNKKALNISN